MSGTPRGIKPRGIPGPVALEGDELFDLAWTADNSGATVLVTRKDGKPFPMIGRVRKFPGATVRIAEGHARAFIEDEWAKLDRKSYGIRGRRAGRKRQAASKRDAEIKAASKGQRP